MLNTTIPESIRRVRNKLLSLKEAAELLGLDYFHARKLLINDDTIGHYTYGNKRMWEKKELLEYKARHYSKNKGENNGSN